MTWTYWNWVVCNVLMGVGVILVAYVIMFILLWRFDQIFFSIIAKLFNIERCIIDVHHTIIRDNTGIFESNTNTMKIRRLISRVCRCCGGMVDEDSAISEDITNLTNDNCFSGFCSCVRETVSDAEKESPTEVIASITKVVQMEPALQQAGQDEVDPASAFVPNTSSARTFSSTSANTNNPTETPDKSASLSTSAQKVSKNHPSHPEYEREILNVYGKYLTLNKKRNKFLIMTITIIVISSVIIAAIEGCFLANITIYQDGSCPVYGVMECFYGPNFTYFQCIPGSTVDFPLYSSSATCFRWIGRDASISDVMTQIGVCTGLLTAFGSVVEVLLRLLIFVFQQRRGVAAGIRRMMEKTVGINRITQPTRCCCITLPWHCGILNLRLYERPWLVIVFLFIYLLLPLIVIGAIVLLSYFRISITSLTYIILLTVVMICSLGLLWVLWEEDEIGRIVPGGWISFKDIISKHTLKNIAMLGKDLISGTGLKTETSRTDDTNKEFTDGTVKTSAKNEVKQEARCAPRDLYRKTQVFPQLTGSAEEIRSKNEVEKSKDLRNFVSRKS